jgi:hypothetical protein
MPHLTKKTWQVGQVGQLSDENPRCIMWGSSQNRRNVMPANFLPTEINQLPGVVAAIDHTDPDRCHPSSHPLWDLAMVMQGLTTPQATPTPAEMEATIHALELQSRDQKGTLDRARASQVVWDALQARLMLQLAHSIHDVGTAERWMVLASKAASESERAAKRVLAAKRSMPKPEPIDLYALQYRVGTH